MSETGSSGPVEPLVGRLRRLADSATCELGDYWNACEEAADELDRLRAENEALRAEKRIPAIFDPDTGRACVVKRHDWCEGPHFWNVWIVRAPPNTGNSRRA